MNSPIDRALNGRAPSDALAFLLRRACIAIASCCIWLLGGYCASRHIDWLPGPLFMFGGAGGFVWATGLYKLWRPLLKALSFYLRFIR
ncbi:hypothetical protein [Burkholderia sp. Ac-20353]|uniref:hypothetical protein n=1 Tax=Burkholderia sp. Ac-20353 TaxID=2703894 RepID=UPI00197B2E72|nr:hypothetical protein [Burkholderia sp. Ac-20353]MBN3785686.1 hypothetical protein [Burkholderia sp. Ac-20353]